MQLAVGFADLVVLLGLFELADDKFDDRLFDFRTRSVFRQFGFDLVFDALGYLGDLERIVEHQQRVVVAVFGAVAGPCVFCEVRCLGSDGYGAEAFARGGEVLRGRKRRNGLDTRLRVNVVHDVARKRTPFWQLAVFDLDALCVCFVEEQRDFATVQETQKVVGRLAVEIGITRGIVRVVDDDRRIFAEKVPQAAAVVE